MMKLILFLLPLLASLSGSGQTFKPSDSTIGISSNGDIYVTSGFVFDTSWPPIETGCYFTFPNGKRITCDSLYVLFEKVSRYENKLDSLINEMRRFDLYRFWLDNDSLYKPGRSRNH